MERKLRLEHVRNIYGVGWGDAVRRELEVVCWQNLGVG